MIEILIITLLILLNGMFSMAEIALVSARKSKLSVEAKAGDKGATTALNLAENPDKFLSTVQIGITLIGILTGIFSGATISILLSDYLEELGLSNSYALSVSKIVIVVIVTYLTLIFGELLPKRIGMSKAERIAKFMSRPMNILAKIMSPFVALLSGSTTLLFKVLGIKENDNKITEEEIKSIVQEGAEDGVVQQVEQDIVERVFMIGDLSIDSIMTHRAEITSLDINMTAEEVRLTLAHDMHDSYPVIDGDLDNILGTVTLKHLVLALPKPDFKLSSILTEATYFYEHMEIYAVLEHMKQKHTTRGFVVDEYGSFIGIVTLKDIMESLVGALPESPDDQQIIAREDGNSWLVSGNCTMLDFLTYFDQEEDITDCESKTVAGLCINHLKHIPLPSESFVWKNFHIEVVDMDRAKIDKILVSKINIYPL